MSTQLNRYPFVVGVKPDIDAYCVWDDDLVELDLHFLNRIDPAYFDHMALLHGNLLSGEDADDAKYAATALRAAYSHGMETMFALICAAVQAHQCVSAWMLKYKPVQLEKIVRAIHVGNPVPNRLTAEQPRWKTLAEILNPIETGDAEKDAWIKKGFAVTWRRLASEFVNEETIDEYNSIKHGLRLSQGGFSLAFGLEETPGVPAPPENMRTMVNSQFGSSYLKASKYDTRNFRMLEKSLNWNPMKFVYALQLISMSINNIVRTLKIWHGIEPSEVLFLHPASPESFETPWKQSQPGFTSFNVNTMWDPSEVKLYSREDILATYPPSGMPNAGNSAAQGGSAPGQDADDTTQPST